MEIETTTADNSRDTVLNAAKPAEGKGEEFRVLVIDDNIDGADTMALLLETMGYEARALYDGAMVVETVRSWRPHAVLMDLALPDTDGYTLARALRAELLEVQPVLIALTGWSRPQDSVATRAAGFSAHLVKPIELDVIESLLERVKAGVTPAL